MREYAEGYLSPKKGRCPESQYANGWHTTAIIPTECVLDGGIPGDIGKVFCVNCGKEFIENWFIPKDQPREIRK